MCIKCELKNMSKFFIGTPVKMTINIKKKNSKIYVLNINS